MLFSLFLSLAAGDMHSVEKPRDAVPLASAIQTQTLYNAPLKDSAGATVSLDVYADGRPLAVVVIKGTWCPVCVEEMKRLSDMNRKWAEMDVRIVFLSSDSIQQLRTFKGHTPLPLPLVSDPGGHYLNALQMYVPSQSHPYPGVLFFDSCGQLQHTIKGRRPGRPQHQQIQNVLKTMRAGPESCENAPLG